MSKIVYGPQACGKTRNAAALAKHFGLSRVVDDWAPGDEMLDDALLLTNEDMSGVEGATAFSDAMVAMWRGKGTLPICTDCLHHRQMKGGDHGCGHPQLGTDTNLVTGHVTPRTRCISARQPDGACGPDGLLYAPTDEVVRRPVCKNLIRAPYQRRAETPACCLPSVCWPSESANPSKEIACSGCAFSPNSH